MRISDWSSDVCSSDLLVGRMDCAAPCPHCVDDRNAERGDIVAVAYPAGRPPCDVEAKLQPASADQPKQRSEERRVGKEWVVRVDLGGRRLITKKSKTEIQTLPTEQTYTIRSTQ